LANTPWLDQVLPGEMPAPLDPDTDRTAKAIFDECPTLISIQSPRPVPREPPPESLPAGETSPLGEEKRELRRLLKTEPDYDRTPSPVPISRKRPAVRRRAKAASGRKRFPLVGV